MADTIRQVEYFYVQVPNKPGEAARALGVLTSYREVTCDPEAPL